MSRPTGDPSRSAVIAYKGSYFPNDDEPVKDELFRTLQRGKWLRGEGTNYSRECIVKRELRDGATWFFVLQSAFLTFAPPDDEDGRVWDDGEVSKSTRWYSQPEWAQVWGDLRRKYNLQSIG